MTGREKFLAVMNFDTASPVPNWEFAYWGDTLERWYDEGMPRSHGYKTAPFSQWVAAEATCHESADGFPLDAHEYFGFDEGICGVPVNMGMVPPLPVVELGGDDENIFLRREDGKTVKTRRDGGSMPEFMDYPIKTAEDFERFADHFDASDPSRFPIPLDSDASWAKPGAPRQIWGGVFTGFYSVVRELMGFEGSLFAFYDNPELVVRIQEFFSDFRMELFARALEHCEIDYVLIWEDMAFKNGPMISPAMFDEFILPYYKRFTDMLRGRFGIKNIFVDCDGDFSCLIPSFIKGGVTGFYPFEVQAGMDIERIREAYPDLIIMGGIDKMALSAGRDAIGAELKKAGRMLEKGGFIPYTDHMVPPDVSLSDYRYFRAELKKLLDRG